MSDNKKKRAANGELKPYPIKDGRFGIAASLGKDENGKRHRHIETGKTEQQAIEKMRRWLSKNGYLNDEAAVLNGQSTAQELVKAFKLKSLLASGISDATYENYGYALKHFEKHFCNCRLCLVDAKEMTRFFNAMANLVENGTYKYGKCSLERAKYITHRMFDWAVEEDYLPDNPMDSKKFKMPEANKINAPITALSEDDLSVLKRALQENKVVYPVIELMSITGLGTEEALALHWEDIDFSEGKINIHRAIVKKNEWDENGEKIRGYTDEGPTKCGKADRIISVPDDVIDMLKEWKQNAPNVSKTKTGSEDYVFGNSKGPSWTYAGFRSSVNRCLEKSCVGIDSLRLHRLRHTVATMLSEQPDVTVFNIMQLLGHKQIKTAQVYIDAQTEKRREKNKELMSRLSTAKISKE